MLPDDDDDDDDDDDMLPQSVSAKVRQCITTLHTYCLLISCRYKTYDNLPALSAPKAKELCDELTRYLSTDPEQVDNVLLWWHERKSMYPHLSRMALDYLTIPGE